MCYAHKHRTVRLSPFYPPLKTQQTHNTPVSQNKSYTQIVRSTFMFGGAQVANIVIGIIRNKLIAILLGTIGMGLISIFQSTLDLIKSITSIGMDTTGVREVSLAANDKKELTITASIIQRWAFILGSSGAILCILFCNSISNWAFDDTSHATEIAWLSISVLFNILAIGELVILQGLRQIGFMIKSGLLWNITALFILTPLYYYFGLNAVVPVFIIVSVLTYLATLYYRLKTDVRLVRVPFQEVWTRGKFILRIGFFIVLGAIQTQIALFMVRVMVINELGLEQLGLLQAAWTISNVYLTLTLKSMSADFYPRLSAVSTSNMKVRKLINEQVHVILIISLPIIIFLLVGSKLLLQLLYTDSFESAYTLLNWRSIGIFFKVVSWAISFVLLARGKGLLYFITDTLYSVIYLVCIYYLFPYFKLDAVGIAYMVAYISYFLMVYFIIRKQFQFRWKRENIRTGLFCLVCILATFYVMQFGIVDSLAIELLILGAASAYALIKLNTVINYAELYRKIFTNKASK